MDPFYAIPIALAAFLIFAIIIVLLDYLSSKNAKVHSHHKA